MLLLNLQAPKCGAELLFSGLEPWAKDLLLDKHNEMRQKVASGGEPGQPGAANMQKLSWNDELETVAQRWADQCRSGQDEIRNLCDGTSVGQNIFVASWDEEEPVESVKEAVSQAVDAGTVRSCLQGLSQKISTLTCKFTDPQLDSHHQGSSTSNTRTYQARHLIYQCLGSLMGLKNRHS